MRTFFSLVAAGVVGLGVSLAVVGCSSPTNASKDKMSGDKMGGDKMGAKMDGDKMAADKMGGDKMGDKKDKMDDTKK
jgi:pentapeptide MXKDX repeat protein